MFVVTGYFTINPDLRAEAEAAIATCVAATLAEDGCIDYRYSADLIDPQRINLSEQWETQEAMDVHMTQPHMAEFMNAFGPCLGGPMEVITHEVSSSTKFL